MKWILGGSVLGVAALVASGRLPLMWVVYCVAVLFIAVGLALAWAYFRRKHPGLLIMGVTYVASAILAMWIREWWPLAGGYALVWGMRAMGLEPPVETLPGAPSATPTAEVEKKT